MTTIQLHWQHLWDETIEGTMEGSLPLRIGRAVDNDVVLADAIKSVSRHHAVLQLIKGQVVVQDVGSLNGLYVNGRSITQITIGRQAEMFLGAFMLTVQLTHPCAPKCSNSNLGTANVQQIEDTTIVETDENNPIILSEPTNGVENGVIRQTAVLPPTNIPH